MSDMVMKNIMRLVVAAAVITISANFMMMV